MGVIVVGVDHSAGAKAALRFALEEARLRQATLRVVHAWQFAYIGATGLEGALPAMGGELEDFREGAEAELDQTLSRTLSLTAAWEEHELVEVDGLVAGSAAAGPTAQDGLQEQHRLRQR